MMSTGAVIVGMIVAMIMNMTMRKGIIAAMIVGMSMSISKVVMLTVLRRSHRGGTPFERHPQIWEKLPVNTITFGSIR